MRNFSWRSFLRRVQLLMLIVGYLALVLAGFFLISALVQDALSTARPKQLRWAAHYATGGAALLLLHFLLFILPHTLRTRLSPHYRQRHNSSVDPQRLSSQRSRRGGVLILTLVLLSLLAVLLVQAQVVARGRLTTERASEQTAQLRRAAGDAVWAALQRLADDPDLGLDTTNEAWAARTEHVTPFGISVLTRVYDAQRRFDLNNLGLPQEAGVRSTDEVVMDVLTLCGDFTPVAKVNALRDYLDQDNAGLYEAAHYADRAPPVACPNRGLLVWGELLPVEGWTRAQFDRKPHGGALRTFEADLVDCLTLLPVPRQRPLPVNVNTASRETLTGILGLAQSAFVDSLLALRELKPIRDLDVLAATMEPAFFETVRPYLAVGSSLFEVEARAFAGGRSEQIRALASRAEDGRMDILQWLF